MTKLEKKLAAARAEVARLKRIITTAATIAPGQVWFEQGGDREFAVERLTANRVVGLLIVPSGDEADEYSQSWEKEHFVKTFRRVRPR